MQGKFCCRVALVTYTLVQEHLLDVQPKKKACGISLHYWLVLVQADTSNALVLSHISNQGYMSGSGPNLFALSSPSALGGMCTLTLQHPSLMAWLRI